MNFQVLKLYIQTIFKTIYIGHKMFSTLFPPFIHFFTQFTMRLFPPLYYSHISSLNPLLVRYSFFMFSRQCTIMSVWWCGTTTSKNCTKQNIFSHEILIYCNQLVFSCCWLYMSDNFFQVEFYFREKQKAKP